MAFVVVCILALCIILAPYWLYILAGLGIVVLVGVCYLFWDEITAACRYVYQKVSPLIRRAARYSWNQCKRLWSSIRKMLSRRVQSAS